MDYTIIKKKGLEDWINIIKYKPPTPKEGSGSKPDPATVLAMSEKRKVTTELLEAVMKNDSLSFAKYIEKVVADGNGESYEGSADIPKLKIEKYTPGHMIKMPPKDIKVLHDQLRDLPIDIASSPYFWCALTLQEMKLKKIQPQSLLHISEHGNNNDTKLKHVLNPKIEMSMEKKIKISEGLARRAIRSLCGPGLFRGLPELIADCSLAKAWWCGRLTWEAQKVITSSNQEQMIEALNRQWETLASYLSGRLTVLRESNIIAGITLWLLATNPRSINSNTVKVMVKKLGQVASYQLLCLNEPIVIKETIDEIMSNNST